MKFQDFFSSKFRVDFIFYIKIKSNCGKKQKFTDPNFWAKDVKCFQDFKLPERVYRRQPGLRRPALGLRCTYSSQSKNTTQILY